MKSYIKGLITGGVLVFSFMVLTGSNSDALYDTDDIYEKLGVLDQNVRDIKFDVTEVESVVNSIKRDVRSIKSDVGSMYIDVRSIKSDVGSIDIDVSSMVVGVNCY